MSALDNLTPEQETRTLARIALAGAIGPLTCWNDSPTRLVLEEMLASLIEQLVDEIGGGATLDLLDDLREPIDAARRDACAFIVGLTRKRGG